MSFALLGNAGSFFATLFLAKPATGQCELDVFVNNLCVADLFMGVYLAVTCVADLLYRGEYLWHDHQWGNSVACVLAGCLWLVSSQVSAFTLVLITLDRFLVLRFPFSGLHFSKQPALAACVVAWTVGIVLASVPLLPVTSRWQFYSQTAICVPLPFATEERFEGHSYSLGVVIVVNFVLFTWIGAGQVAIYRSVHKTSMALSVTESSDVAGARRLTTVVMSDFLCWLPVGLLGLLAATGTPVPEEVNVAVAVLVLPINSALNPFLYTFNVLLEKRRHQQRGRLLKQLRATVQAGKADAAGRPSAPASKETVVEEIKVLMKNHEVLVEDILATLSRK